MTTPFADKILGGLFGDPEISGLLSPERRVRRMLGIEAAHALALGRAGIVDEHVAKEAAAAIVGIAPDFAGLAAGTAEDGVPVPTLVRQIRAALPERLHEAVHAGLTSQDVIDTALILGLRDVLAILRTRIETLTAALDDLSETHGDRPLMARTRMQAAVEITVADRIAAWRTPWSDHAARLDELEPRLLKLQFGGAAGNRGSFGEQGPSVGAALADALELAEPGRSWHTSRSGIAELGGWLSMVTGTLGKAGQDIALMAQQGIDEIALVSGGSSSAMHHKRNPVSAELLVTLARFNATMVAGLHQSLVHEQERSGAAWAVEWMILPQMLEATGRALVVGTELLENIVHLGAPGRPVLRLEPGGR